MSDKEMLDYIDERIGELVAQGLFGHPEHMMWAKARMEVLSVMLSKSAV